MWRTYFPKGRIYGIDIFDKSRHDERRIKTFKGSQADDVFLKQVLETTGTPDIIIDDGSHLNEHVIHTFKVLFPVLRDQGIYVIEDTQTSYWKRYGGSSEEFNRPDTSMGYLKSLTDGLNHTEFENRTEAPTYLEQHISEIHFYHNLVFIYKK